MLHIPNCPNFTHILLIAIIIAISLTKISPQPAITRQEPLTAPPAQLYSKYLTLESIPIAHDVHLLTHCPTIPVTTANFSLDLSMEHSRDRIGPQESEIRPNTTLSARQTLCVQFTLDITDNISFGLGTPLPVTFYADVVLVSNPIEIIIGTFLLPPWEQQHNVMIESQTYPSPPPQNNTPTSSSPPFFYLQENLYRRIFFHTITIPSVSTHYFSLKVRMGADLINDYTHNYSPIYSVTKPCKDIYCNIPDFANLFDRESVNITDCMAEGGSYIPLYHYCMCPLEKAGQNCRADVLSTFLISLTGRSYMLSRTPSERYLILSTCAKNLEIMINLHLFAPPLKQFIGNIHLTSNFITMFYGKQSVNDLTAFFSPYSTDIWPLWLSTGPRDSTLDRVLLYMDEIQIILQHVILLFTINTKDLFSQYHLNPTNPMFIIGGLLSQTQSRTYDGFSRSHYQIGQDENHLYEDVTSVYQLAVNFSFNDTTIGSGGNDTNIVLSSSLPILEVKFHAIPQRQYDIFLQLRVGYDGSHLQMKNDLLLQLKEEYLRANPVSHTAPRCIVDLVDDCENNDNNVKCSRKNPNFLDIIDKILTGVKSQSEFTFEIFIDSFMPEKSFQEIKIAALHPLIYEALQSIFFNQTWKHDEDLEIPETAILSIKEASIVVKSTIVHSSFSSTPVNFNDMMNFLEKTFKFYINNSPHTMMGLPNSLPIYISHNNYPHINLFNNNPYYIPSIPQNTTLPYSPLNTPKITPIFSTYLIFDILLLSPLFYRSKPLFHLYSTQISYFQRVVSPHTFTTTLKSIVAPHSKRFYLTVLAEFYDIPALLNRVPECLLKYQLLSALQIDLRYTKNSLTKEEIELAELKRQIFVDLNASQTQTISEFPCNFLREKGDESFLTENPIPIKTTYNSFSDWVLQDFSLTIQNTDSNPAAAEPYTLITNVKHNITLIDLLSRDKHLSQVVLSHCFHYLARIARTIRFFSSGRSAYTSANPQASFHIDLVIINSLTIQPTPKNVFFECTIAAVPIHIGKHRHDTNNNDRERPTDLFLSTVDCESIFYQICWPELLHMMTFTRTAMCVDQHHTPLPDEECVKRGHQQPNPYQACPNFDGNALSYTCLSSLPLFYKQDSNGMPRIIDQRTQNDKIQRYIDSQTNNVLITKDWLFDAYPTNPYSIVMSPITGKPKFENDPTLSERPRVIHRGDPIYSNIPFKSTCDYSRIPQVMVAKACMTCPCQVVPRELVCVLYIPSSDEALQESSQNTSSILNITIPLWWPLQDFKPYSAQLVLLDQNYCDSHLKPIPILKPTPIANSACQRIYQLSCPIHNLVTNTISVNLTNNSTVNPFLRTLPDGEYYLAARLVPRYRLMALLQREESILQLISRSLPPSVRSPSKHLEMNSLIDDREFTSSDGKSAKQVIMSIERDYYAVVIQLEFELANGTTTFYHPEPSVGAAPVSMKLLLPAHIPVGLYYLVFSRYRRDDRKFEQLTASYRVPFITPLCLNALGNYKDAYNQFATFFCPPNDASCDPSCQEIGRSPFVPLRINGNKPAPLQPRLPIAECNAFCEVDCGDHGFPFIHSHDDSHHEVRCKCLGNWVTNRDIGMDEKYSRNTNDIVVKKSLSCDTCGLKCPLHYKPDLLTCTHCVCADIACTVISFHGTLIYDRFIRHQFLHFSRDWYENLNFTHFYETIRHGLAAELLFALSLPPNVSTVTLIPLYDPSHFTVYDHQGHARYKNDQDLLLGLSFQLIISFSSHFDPVTNEMRQNELTLAELIRNAPILYKYLEILIKDTILKDVVMSRSVISPSNNPNNTTSIPSDFSRDDSDIVIGNYIFNITVTQRSQYYTSIPLPLFSSSLIMDYLVPQHNYPQYPVASYCFNVKTHTYHWSRSPVNDLAISFYQPQNFSLYDTRTIQKQPVQYLSLDMRCVDVVAFSKLEVYSSNQTQNIQVAAVPCRMFPQTLPRYHHVAIFHSLSSAQQSGEIWDHIQSFEPRQYPEKINVEQNISFNLSMILKDQTLDNMSQKLNNSQQLSTSEIYHSTTSNSLPLELTSASFLPRSRDVFQPGDELLVKWDISPFAHPDDVLYSHVLVEIVSAHDPNLIYQMAYTPALFGKVSITIPSNLHLGIYLINLILVTFEASKESTLTFTKGFLPPKTPMMNPPTIKNTFLIMTPFAITSIYSGQWELPPTFSLPFNNHPVSPLNRIPHNSLDNKRFPLSQTEFNAVLPSSTSRCHQWSCGLGLICHPVYFQCITPHLLTDNITPLVINSFNSSKNEFFQLYTPNQPFYVGFKATRSISGYEQSPIAFLQSYMTHFLTPINIYDLNTPNATSLASALRLAHPNITLLAPENSLLRRQIDFLADMYDISRLTKRVDPAFSHKTIATSTMQISVALALQLNWYQVQIISSTPDVLVLNLRTSLQYNAPAFAASVKRSDHPNNVVEDVPANNLSQTQTVSVIPYDPLHNRLGNVLTERWHTLQQQLLQSPLYLSIPAVLTATSQWATHIFIDSSGDDRNLIKSANSNLNKPNRTLTAPRPIHLIIFPKTSSQCIDRSLLADLVQHRGFSDASYRNHNEHKYDLASNAIFTENISLQHIDFPVLYERILNHMQTYKNIGGAYKEVSTHNLLKTVDDINFDETCQLFTFLDIYILDVIRYELLAKFPQSENSFQASDRDQDLSTFDGSTTPMALNYPHKHPPSQLSNYPGNMNYDNKELLYFFWIPLLTLIIVAFIIINIIFICNGLLCYAHILQFKSKRQNPTKLMEKGNSSILIGGR